MNDNYDISDQETQADRVLRAAFSYASQGFRVIPLRAGMKVPVQRDWPDAASKDPQVILEWFGPGGDFVGCNLGIATGKASNLWVLDVDLGHGPEAAVSIARLVAEFGVIGETRRVRTPSGGFHYWFAWPDEVPNPETGELPTWRNINATAATALGAGIDVRAEGGQVAVWPSILTDGAEYQQGEGPLLPVPKWLAEKTVYVEKTIHGSSVSKVDLDAAGQDRASRYALQAVNGVVDDLKELSAAKTPDVASYRGAPWNATTFAKACRLIEVANADWSPISEAEAFDLLYEHAPRDGGFTDEDVATIWRSALRTVGEKAATLPDADLNLGGSIFGTPVPAVNPSLSGRDSATVNPHDGLPLFTDRGKPEYMNIALRICGDDIALGTDGDTWVWEGGVWKRSPDEIVKRAARLLGNRWSHNYLSSIKDQVHHTIGLPRLGDTPRLDLINTRSGMLDWKTGTLLPHDPELKSTIQLPVEWDPEATCPRFDAWVSQVVSAGVAPRLWEVIGYMVAPGNPLQKAILLHGPGGNGKGTLIRVLTALIGSWNTSAVTLQSMAEKSYSVADLYGKQANLAGDIDSKFLRDTATFKLITGGDNFEARRIYGSPFEFICHATPLFSANETWRSADNTAGYRRRWVILPMTADVTKMSPLDENDLLAELPGILVKAVAALRQVMDARDFTESVETLQAKEEFDTFSDAVKSWLAEDDVITAAVPGDTDPKRWTHRTALYNRFAKWSRDNGYEHPQVSGKFFKALEAAGFIPKGRPGATSQGGGRGFLGITVNATFDGIERMTFASS